MMKVKATLRSGPVVILGLSHANLDQLKADGLKKGYILIEGKEIGVPFDIWITAGSTEAEMMQAFSEFVGPDTAVTIDERLKSWSDKLTAPWTASQVDALNRYQRAGFVHPFTCPEGHYGFDRTLFATKDGWICPHCDYRQDWAHEAMLETPVDPTALMRLQVEVEKAAAILSMLGVDGCEHAGKNMDACIDPPCRCRASARAILRADEAIKALAAGEKR